MDEPTFLAEVRRLADTVFRPRAEITDQSGPTGPIRENIRLLADLGCFGLGIDPKYGGFGAPDYLRREYTELVASACGATSFAQMQLHSGGGFFGNAPSEEARLEMLPKFASGESLCGTAISHLRRRGAPMVVAERQAGGGVRVTGTAPWVTSWSFIDGFVLGAQESQSGNHIYVYVAKKDNEGHIAASPTMELAAMTSSDTVEVSTDGLFIPEKYILSERPPEALIMSDFCGITGYVTAPLGCVRGSAHLLNDLSERRGSAELADAATAILREADACRAEALRWNGSCSDLPEYKERAMYARTWAIILSVRAAHAAVAATGGSAHLLTNPAQRLMREAMFYTTVAQTGDVRSGTLDMLISPECWNIEA